jgi:hypothetical protein
MAFMSRASKRIQFAPGKLTLPQKLEIQQIREKCIGLPGATHLYFWKNKKIIQKSLKNQSFYKIKDEYLYCTYKNISLGNYFYFILGKKQTRNAP